MRDVVLDAQPKTQVLFIRYLSNKRMLKEELCEDLHGERQNQEQQ